MTSTKSNVRSRGTRIALAATLVAAAALAFSGDALAGGKHKHFKHHRHGHSHGAVVYAPAPVRLVPIVVPTRIYAKKAYRYDPFFLENAWYAPHRHVHAVYRFPVETRYGVAYRPYGYCDGRLVGEVFLPAPRHRVVYDDRPHGYVTFGDARFRIGIGF